jgi:hypothetical protein
MPGEDMALEGKRPQTVAAVHGLQAIGARKEAPDMTVQEPSITKRINVTPAQAQEWLGVNEANRPLRRSSVARMAADMAAGFWNQANPQPLIFDTTGALIDGQHR